MLEQVRRMLICRKQDHRLAKRYTAIIQRSYTEGTLTSCILFVASSRPLRLMNIVFILCTIIDGPYVLSRGHLHDSRVMMSRRSVHLNKAISLTLIKYACLENLSQNVAVLGFLVKTEDVSR